MTASGLRDMLAALVPLRMHELAAVPWERLRLHLDTMTCGVCKDGCRGAAQVVGAHADALQYTPGTPASGAARRALVDGLAVMALVADGGAWDVMGGLHWCARPHEGCPNPGGRPTVPRAVDDPAPARRHDPPAMATVALGPAGEAAL